MGRPTEEKKDKIIKLRVSDEQYEGLVKSAEGESVSLSEYCRRVLGGECLGSSDTLRAEVFVLRNRIKELETQDTSLNTENVHLPVNETTWKDIEKMCKLCGISTGLFFKEVCRLFNEGQIEVENMKLKSNGEYDLDFLLDVCHRINADPQEMINKLASSLVRR